MTTQKLYSKFYVNQKGKLFPMIKKYSGQDPKKMSHGDAIGLYVQLLKSDEGFRAEVDDAISKQYHNALGAILTGITSAVSSITQTQAEKEAQETELYKAVLQDQGSNDTTKILIASGVAIVFVITGVIIVKKMKK